MHETMFLCLAVSRRDGGNCIAGLDLDKGKWVRPVISKSRGALGDSEIVVRDNKTHELRMMKPLDVLRLPLGETVENRAQPENRALGSTPAADCPAILGTALSEPLLSEKIRALAETSNWFSLIFGTSTNCVPHSAIEEEPPSHSLCIVRPRNLLWARSKSYHGTPRIVGWFTFGEDNTRYALPMTDIDWEPKLLGLTLKKPTLSGSQSPGLDPTKEILLTVSLGDHFRETGNHYKLIAGVLLLPKK